MASAFVSSCLPGSRSRWAPVSPFALRRGMGLLQPMTWRFGDPPPHLGCLWCSRQCRRSSWARFPCPCCATTRAHGARDSAGAVHPLWCRSLSLCFSTIVATTTVVTSHSSSTDCPYSAAPMCCESVYVAMSCGGGFYSGGANDSVWDSVKPMIGNYFFTYFQYQRLLGVFAC